MGQLHSPQIDSNRFSFLNRITNYFWRLGIHITLIAILIFCTVTHSDFYRFARNNFDSRPSLLAQVRTINALKKTPYALRFNGKSLYVVVCCPIAPGRIDHGEFIIQWFWRRTTAGINRRISVSSTNSAWSRDAVWTVGYCSSVRAWLLTALQTCSLCDCIKAASAFCCQSSAGSTVLSTEFLWTSGLLCCLSDDVKLYQNICVILFTPTPSVRLCTFTQDISLFRVYTAH